MIIRHTDPPPVRQAPSHQLTRQPARLAISQLAMTHPTHNEHSPSDGQSQIAQRRDRPQKVVGAILRAAIPIAILAAGYYAYSIFAEQSDKTKAPPVEEKPLRTRVAELRIQDYPVVITTNGIVQPHNQVDLSAQVSGQITDISPVFEVGAYFSKGEVLVELDARDHQTAVAVAEARYLSAESALQLATQVHQRTIKLYQKKGVSKADVDQAAAAQAQATAELDSSTAQVEQAKRDLTRTQIRAPFDGRVRQKMVGLGQLVNSGTTLGVVFAIDFAEVRLPIAGRELQYLDLPEMIGDRPVDVELRDAINTASETVWNARIVRTEGTLDEDSLELFAIARIDDPFGRTTGAPPLRIGQPVVASIAGNALSNVVAVPRSAVRQLDQVFFVEEDTQTLSAKTIFPLWSDAEHVIVRDPTIKDGALLSTTRLVYAPDGAKVEIIPDLEITTATAETSASQTGKPKPVKN